MRTRTRVTTVIAGGVLAAALLASPSLAAGQVGGSGAGPSPTSPAAGSCDGTGTGDGTRAGDGTGATTRRQGRDLGAGMRGTRGDGPRSDLTAVASGTLTDAQKSELAAIAQDEKLAHDLYLAFADTYAVPMFDRVATAETQHLSAVRVLLDRYDVADPTAGQPVGTFSTAAFQELYDDQLAAGSVDLAAAYRVGIFVETTDIDALAASTPAVTAPDVLQVYTNLLAGSERHLTAFSR